MKKIQTLNGEWILRQTSTHHMYPALVPGCVHTDLLAAEVVPDPFYRDNELQQQWIGETDWTYAREFIVSSALLEHDCVLLKFYGLDTIAKIRLNGTEIGSTENMFRTYEFDVKSLLESGDNLLEIDFQSPMQYVRYMDATMGEMAGWIEPMRVNSGAWIRKEPCNFGWDWGPKMPTSGIWRDVELVAFNTGRIADVHILQTHYGDTVELTINTEIEQLNDVELTASITVSQAGTTITEIFNRAFEQDTSSATLLIENPQLWWVNGLGEQPLYDVTVQIYVGETLLDTITKRIGLCVLQLETPDDEWGQAMYFTCNGVKFFAKGANWIPASPYPAEPTREKLEIFVKATADANMNMLRVWGGGIYEEDAFYNLCDEYGIAVWQDFMFACGTYPSTNEAWMANVREEAIQNVKRIRHHASLAVWCGNNEIEQGMLEPAWENTVGWDDYHLLFRDLLGSVVADYDPQTPYWQASPHSPGNHRDPFDQAVGDTHLWEVWHGKQPFEWYRDRQDRFCSEFGFQSFPEPATVYEFTAPEDRNITSYVMEHHQRSEIGNGTIIHYMLDWYQLPTSFENMIWLSQILQGMAMKYAVEHWRRNMPRTMGTLYWQLNDMWGAPSWASIDWHGRWKALHYMAKRFNNRLLISGVENVETNTVDVHVTSDEIEPIQGDILLTVTDVAGIVISTHKQTEIIAANTNTFIRQFDLSEHVDAYGQRDLLIWLQLEVGGEYVSDNLVLLSRPKHIDLHDPQLAVHVDEISDTEFDITISVQAPALYVWCELTDAQFSDNFMDLRPNYPRTIRVAVPEAMTVSQFEQQVSVKSLYNTYQSKNVH